MKIRIEYSIDTLYMESFKENSNIHYVKSQLILNNSLPRYEICLVLNEYLGECVYIKYKPSKQSSGLSFLSDYEIKQDNFYYKSFNSWK